MTYTQYLNQGNNPLYMPLVYIEENDCVQIRREGRYIQIVLDYNGRRIPYVVDLDKSTRLIYRYTDEGKPLYSCFRLSNNWKETRQALEEMYSFYGIEANK